MLSEERLADNITSGKFDLYGEIVDVNDKTLGDYKITSADNLHGNFKIDKDALRDLPEEIRNNPEAILEYLYRSQMRIKVEEVQIEDGRKQISLSLLDQNPLLSSNQSIDTQYVLCPLEFPALSPISLKYKDDDGTIYEETIEVERVAYSSMTQIKIISKSFRVLRLVMIISDQGKEMNKSSFAFTVVPKAANNIDEVVTAMAFAKGFQKGTVQVNGAILKSPSTTSTDIDLSELENRFSFWKKMRLLEECLSTTFSPAYEPTYEDQALYSELCHCLLSGGDLIYRHPFNEFKVPSEHANTFKGDEWNTKSALSFIEDTELSFWGEKLKLFSVSVLIGFKIISVITNDGSKEMCTIQIDNASNQDFVLIKSYTTSYDVAESFIKATLEDYKDL